MAIKELFNDVRPQVLFDPRASQRIDPRFKFTRAGAASYYNKQGNLVFASANQPRVDAHEPDDSGVMQPVGFYTEGAITNLMPRSQDMDLWPIDGNTWQQAGTSIAGNVHLAPDLTQTADLLTETTDNSLHHRTNWFIYTITAGAYYTHSAFVKPAGRSTFYIYYRDSSRVFFDLNTGAISGGPPNASLVGSGIIPLANGWFRVYATSLGVGPYNTGHGIGLSQGTTVTYAGDGVSGLYVWGLQVEKQSILTSYIPTPGASNTTVTRAADLLSIEAPLPSTGSIYIDARSLGSAVDTTLLSAAPASPSTDKLALAIRQPASLYNSKALVYEVDGAFKPTLPFPVPTSTRERNLITYGANNYHYRSNSARYTPSSSSSVPANMTRLGIGHDVTDPTKAMTGYINAVYLWSDEITPTVAEALVRGDVEPQNADAGLFAPTAGALAFVFNTGTDRIVTLPLRGSTNNVIINWGDNSTSSASGAQASSNISHTYAEAGLYPVEITSGDPRLTSGLQQIEFGGNNGADLALVSQWGGTTTYKPTVMYRAFSGCTQMDFADAARTNLPDTSKITNWSEAFDNCSSISGVFPSFNFSSATNFYATWRGCSSLETLPALGDQTALVTNFSSAWNGCTSLTSFPQINTSSATNFAATWQNCSSLTSFPLINTSLVTGFSNAWNGCSSLTTFPQLDTSSATNMLNTWAYCNSLTSFPLINTSAVTELGSAWTFCSSLTSFPLIDTSSCVGMNSTWNGCSSLTSFPAINTSNVTSLTNTWKDCDSLTSFPSINTSNVTNFGRTWYSCTALTSFPSLNFNSAVGSPADSSTSYTGFRETWRLCTSLATFPANAFDSTTCTRFLDAFRDCALTAASIENILVSINTANTSDGDLGLSGGTNAAKSTWTTTANIAYDALVARGWTITFNA